MKAISHFLHFVTLGSKTDECPASASAVSIFMCVFFKEVRHLLVDMLVYGWNGYVVRVFD